MSRLDPMMAGIHEDRFTLVDQASTDARAQFIGRVYLHLLGAVLAFAGLTTVMLQTDIALRLTELVFLNGQLGWLVILGLFIAVSWVANSWAQSGTSPATQYAGLGLYVLAESILFAPLLLLAQTVGGPEVIPTAGVLTLMVFAALTFIVWFTRYNFSFLGPALGVAGIAIFATFVVSMIFGYSLASLGLWLPAGLVVFASLYILYDTSNIMHVYRTDQHVAASLALFASVALLFWYMIRLVMAFRDE